MLLKKDQESSVQLLQLISYPYWAVTGFVLRSCSEFVDTLYFANSVHEGFESTITGHFLIIEKNVGFSRN